MSQRRPGCKSNPPKSSFHGSPVLRRGPRFDLVVVVGGPRCWNAAARESLERAAASRPFLPGCSLPGATCCFSSPPPLLLEREPEPEFGCCAGLSNAAPATGFSPVAGGGRLKVGSRQQLSLGRARVPLTRVSPPAPAARQCRHTARQPAGTMWHIPASLENKQPDGKYAQK